MLLAVVLLALPVMVALPASAAAVTAANYQDLMILIRHIDGNVSIFADNMFIYLKNNNASREAVIVFHPQFVITVYGLDGANVGVWNGTSIVVKSDLTKYDVVYQYGGGEVLDSKGAKMGSGALALVIPPGAVARIVRVEYMVPAQEPLSAPRNK